MESIYTSNLGSGIPAGPARIPTATPRPWGEVCPVITPPKSSPVQGTTLPVATPDQDFAAFGGGKRLVMYPPGSTRTDHGG